MTGKKDRLEKRHGSAAAARGHFEGCHLCPRTGAISVAVSKPTFKTQGTVTTRDSDCPTKPDYLSLPALGKRPQHKAHSVQIHLLQGNKVQVSCFQGFSHSAQEKRHQYGVTYDLKKKWMSIINYYWVTCKRVKYWKETGESKTKG